MNYDMILNLGKSSFLTDDERVWNKGQHIIDLIYPGKTRVLFDDLMPPRPTNYPADVWVKQPGAHGRGKSRMYVDYPLVLPGMWDWQEHINGQEYRLVTVGHRLVQDFLRHGENGNRSYEWLPMREVPQELKRMVRLAATRVEGNNVIAWDTIVDETGQPYLLEGNTCPGVTAPTVRRITEEMERQFNER